MKMVMEVEDDTSGNNAIYGNVLRQLAICLTLKMRWWQFCKY